MTTETWKRSEVESNFREYTQLIIDRPYDPRVWQRRASFLRSSDYHDLAAGDFYKALLLVDDALDAAGEYHEQVIESLDSVASIIFDQDNEEEDLPERVVESLNRHALECYQGLAECMLELGCIRDAYSFCQRGLALKADHTILQSLRKQFISVATAKGALSGDVEIDLEKLPSKSCARRELYPWDEHEPNRYSEETINSINERLKEVAPRCVVRAVDLPDLHGGHGTVKQLGLFAREDIEPGTTVLQEKSLLAVNNRLHDELCDACSAELPKDPLEAKACPDCGTSIFCSQDCIDQAIRSYHPAACGNEDYEAINKDVELSEATDALYGLLLGRAICMSETQDVHPLDLPETRYIWGDYSPWLEPSKFVKESFTQVPQRPRTLPWSFESNIAGPIHVLESLDIDIYSSSEKYDLWVLNTLFAKFRGVANARMNPRSGKPEVAAVHPLWCLANHSCAPNVTWEWGGEIRMWARDGSKGETVRWGERMQDEYLWKGGVHAGDEILNHYTDVRLPVKERRAWAAGALGGDCLCPRCLYESAQGNEDQSLSS